ncbi:MAG: hypothetical protein KQI62_03235 [Deltaproteobacteria bacterium]|nr:hypothetical protein [Deltaproteobacteria bacterium]
MFSLTTLRVFLVCLLSLFLVFSLGTNTVRAIDAGALFKEINSELRSAQKDMFSGKTDSAIAKLGPIREMLDQAKAADPNNYKVKSYENKYLKLVKDLERRTGKSLGGGSITAQKSSATKLPPKPEVKPLATKSEAASAEAATGKSVDSLASQANALLRSTEKAAFAGKPDEAAAELAEAKQAIDQLKATDPKNTRLRGLESKYNQLDKRLAATAKAATSAAASTTPAPKTGQGGAKAASGKLPYKARRPFTQAKNQLARMDSYISRLNDPGYRGDKKQLANNAAKAVAQARENLAAAKAEAAKAGVASHPDFDQMEADLNAAEKQIAEATAKVQKQMAQAQAASQEVMADTAKLMKVYEQVRPVMDKATGSVIYYNDLKPARELLVMVEKFEGKDQAKVKLALAEFSSKYGTTAEAIDAKAKVMGYHGNYSASYAYTELSNGLVNIAKTREVMADDLIRKASKMQKQSQKGLHDFFRVKNHAKIKQWAAMAAQFDADNPRVKEFQAGLDGWINKDMAALNAKIEKATWPSNAGGAPENASELASVIKQYMQKESDKDAAKGKDPRQIIGVVITGSWRVFTKNILGEPIQWGLPIYWAEVWQSEKDMNLARVYNGTMLTQKFKGVKKAPPFVGAAVGDSYYIRPGKVK